MGGQLSVPQVMLSISCSGKRDGEYRQGGRGVQQVFLEVFKSDFAVGFRGFLTGQTTGSRRRSIRNSLAGQRAQACVNTAYTKTFSDGVYSLQ